MSAQVNGIFQTLYGRINSILFSPLYRNSLYLMAATITSSGAGFVFWWVSAQITSPSDVGLASAAIAAITLLKSIGEIGLSTTLIHFGASQEKGAVKLLSTLIVVKWFLMLVITLGFVVGLPIFSPGLMPLYDSPAVLIAFIIFTVIDGILALQDLAMLNLGKGQYVLFRQLACNLPPTVLLLIFAQFVTTYEALFLAYVIPNMVVGVVTSLYVLPNNYPGYRFFGSFNLEIFRNVLPYGMANYISDLLWSLPGNLIPVITISILSADETGFFNISWLIFGVVLIIPRVSTTSMFVEVSKNKDAIWVNALKTIRFVVLLITPICVVMWLFGDFILSVFGKDYSNIELLRILLLSAYPFSINSVHYIMLRAIGNLWNITIFALFSALATSVSLFVLSSIYGMNGIGYAWLLGQSLTMIFPLVVIGRRYFR